MQQRPRGCGEGCSSNLVFVREKWTNLTIRHPYGVTSVEKDASFPGPAVRSLTTTRTRGKARAETADDELTGTVWTLAGGDTAPIHPHTVLLLLGTSRKSHCPVSLKLNGITGPVLAKKACSREVTCFISGWDSKQAHAGCLLPLPLVQPRRRPRGPDGVVTRPVSVLARLTERQSRAEPLPACVGKVWGINLGFIKPLRIQS